MASIKRDYKSSMFSMLWENKEELLSLYNAVNGTGYTNADDLIINTLRNAIYMGMKNDISFIFDMSLNLYEHQSTINPNMPLRDLFYVAQVLQGIIKDENLYGTALVKIPTPKFVVFYNGITKQPERQTLRLSDSFNKKCSTVNLELVVEVININPGNNNKLLKNCKRLREYVLYIERVRNYVADMHIEEAVERAVNECIAEGILADFLSQNKAEAIAMSIFEYNQEAHMKCVRQEGYEIGRAEGKAEGKAEDILELLGELGEVSDELREKIFSTNELCQLKNWLKLAAKVESLEQFIKEM
ncbi:MAG: hypothetical protein IJ379_01410 [Lachnospiraceae bacterium]|nr:hypothetical protein [Lachnospiraceae bacterium]